MVVPLNDAIGGSSTILDFYIFEFRLERLVFSFNMAFIVNAIDDCCIAKMSVQSDVLLFFLRAD